MISDFLTAGSNEVNNETRRHKQKLNIVRFLAKSDSECSIPEIAKFLKISVPTVNKLVLELIDEHIVLELGKKQEAESGRKPNLYSINKKIFYSLGVDIQINDLKIALVDLDMKIIKFAIYDRFILENTDDSLNEIISYLRQFISFNGLDAKNCLGIGIGLTGRINTMTGASLTYFNFTPKPLAGFLEDQLKMPVILENDTRATGLAEEVCGVIGNKKNSLIVNVSRGLGLAIISHGKIVRGGNGYAGEFGHMQLGTKQRLCICGKQNCLGTEASGYGLELDFKESLEKGRNSLIGESDMYSYKEIIDIALKGDGLAMDLIIEQGNILGISLGNIINLLNPELIVIGGYFSRLDNVYIDAVKIGMAKTALVNPLKNCKILSSPVDSDYAVVLGSASLFFRKYNLI